MKKLKKIIRKAFGESFFVSLVKIKREFIKMTYLEKEHLRVFAKKICEKNKKEFSTCWLYI